MKPPEEGSPTSLPHGRDEWVADFISEVQHLRAALTHSIKYLNAVAHNEWSRSGGMDDPRAAAQQWTKRVQSAMP